MVSIVPNSPPAASSPGRYTPVASPLHTILVLVAMTAWAFGSSALGRSLIEALSSTRVRLYLLTALLEWLMFALVLLGVWRNGVSSSEILGDRWHSRREVLHDVGIAAGFWIVAAILLRLFGLVWRVTPSGNLLSVLPHGTPELILWVGLAITAGICEEAIFRGYLQRQFIALTKSVPAGILLSAVIFGIAHAYQGPRMILPIGLYGAMFGILAHWRRSVRPGMIAHVWNDALVGVLLNFTRP